jgi:L-arabinose isomerase
MSKIKIGFLPFYLALYDECCADKRPVAEQFVKTIHSKYTERGVEVTAAPICRLKDEFAQAVKDFENAGVDAIVTLHLAYSPSLESAEILAGTKLPLVILDTTPDFEFGFEQDAEAIMFNHGIHGVQDMCNLLIRNGKSFMIEAGHWEKSDVIDRTMKHLKACKMSSVMKKARVGIIGKPFAGMGDFTIPFDTLKETIGMEVVSMKNDKFAKYMRSLTQEDVDSEIKTVVESFDTDKYSQDALNNTIKTGLAVRKWLEAENLAAFTVNFLDVNKASGIPVVPFLEASMGMARGLGYAGEGDVLNSALVAALMAGFPETTFTEMFCPDWKGNSIFLSHMGEINTNLCAGKAVLSERPFPYTDAGNPVIASGCFKPGSAVIVNLAPGPENTYTLIASPVEVCDSRGKEKINNSIRGWIKPQTSVADFLTAYSRLGGTHHLAMSYNADMEILQDFALNMGWNFEVI